MTYVDKGSKICRPTEVKNIEIGDIIVVYPVSLNINGNIITFPPLSLISEKCGNEIQSISWIEGIRISEDIFKNVNFSEGNEYVEGELNILEPSILTAFTLKQLLGKKVSARAKKTTGVPLLSLDKIPIISLENGKVNVGIYFMDYRDIYIKLFSYSIFYYILSRSSEEVS
ncbi:hypothetical protein [Saccharolobus caldissimus]|uniref:Uncharacterized protein n=1 Tax=Saccharolobus caldissimus TaxID=1702097 RepID=A0AAQ4CPU7_9CREN|nr:hypothetical protein [Saccharolobus caldissimus]BDB97828.1 hypothetical protein SACC_08450 [Saccharolobus caldissimus]